MKKFLHYFVLFILIVTIALTTMETSISVFAEESNSSSTEEDTASESESTSESTTETTDETDTSETEPSNELLDTDIVSTDDILLYSSACVVMDVDTGAILYSKNRSDRHYPASTTKILTALVALENSELTDVITFSEEAINSISWDYSNMELEVGDQLTMEEALYGILLASANEAAYGIAEYVSGSSDAFAEEMTEYAISLGCRLSNFTNASGIHDDNHYTTAKDLATIARAAAQNEEFLTITGTVTYYVENVNFKSTTVEEADGTTTLTAVPYELYNHHKMVNGTYTYEGVYGGKTGYTDEARSTLVTYAERDGMNLVCVVLDCPSGNSYHYKDTETALDYCFENYDRLTQEYEEAQELLDYEDTCVTDWYEIEAVALTSIQDYYPNLRSARQIYHQYLGIEDDADAEEDTSNEEPIRSLLDNGLYLLLFIVVAAAIVIVIVTSIAIHISHRHSQKKRHS